MAVKIRLRRMGRKKHPIYSIVATDSRNPRDGRFIEDLGRYYPVQEPAKVDIKEERILYWLQNGAQPTDTVRNLLSKHGLLYRLHLERKGKTQEEIEATLAEWREAASGRKVEAKMTSAERRAAALKAEREKVAAQEAEQAKARAEADAKAKQAAEEAQRVAAAERAKAAEAARVAQEEANVAEQASAPAEAEAEVKPEEKAEEAKPEAKSVDKAEAKAEDKAESEGEDIAESEAAPETKARGKAAEGKAAEAKAAESEEAPEEPEAYEKTLMSPSPDPDELLLVGRLAKSHGIKGEVKMVPESEYPERLLGLKRIFVGRDPVVSSPFVVEHARLQPTRGGSYLLLKLEGISTREQADQLRGMVYAPESDLPLEEDEFFLHDLIGLEVETEDGTPVGIITDLLDLPGHAVYVIGREGLPDALVPAVQEFISDIDLEKGRVVIRPIEGLLE